MSQRIDLGLVKGDPFEYEDFTPEQLEALKVKGDDGVGVSTIVETTTSLDDGGTNVITVTLTNGVQQTFTVKNGKQGSKGDTGEKGLGMVYQTTEPTNIEEGSVWIG